MHAIGVVFHCHFFWAESRYTTSDKVRNDSGSKCRESWMGNKHGKTCDGYKQTIEVTPFRHDAA